MAGGIKGERLAQQPLRPLWSACVSSNASHSPTRPFAHSPIRPLAHSIATSEKVPVAHSSTWTQALELAERTAIKIVEWPTPRTQNRGLEYDHDDARTGTPQKYSPPHSSPRPLVFQNEQASRLLATLAYSPKQTTGTGTGIHSALFSQNSLTLPRSKKTLWIDKDKVQCSCQRDVRSGATRSRVDLQKASQANRDPISCQSERKWG
ncbi:hypothetical protein HOY80DRAFT_999583 [Tuber brumale]|nr:hypothetical protein HOY80DRAFT_999583 [Tuber brumale]